MPRRAPHEQGGHHAQALHRLAWIIAGGVVVQAAAIAFAFGGMLNLVSEGGVVDKALLESFQAAGVGELGFLIHGHRRAASSSRSSRSRCSWSRSSCGCAARKLLGRDHARARRAAGDRSASRSSTSPYLGLIHGANALAVVAAASVCARCASAGAARPERRPTAEEATSDAVSA